MQLQQILGKIWRLKNENVGIGTTSPSAKLEVKDTNSTSTLLYVGDSNTNGSTGLYFNRWAAGTNPMGIQGTIAGVGAGDITLQAQGGNVGIGTTTPGYKLDVQGGDINASGSVRAAGVALTSDIRYKEDIAPLENVLEKILKIRGVSYNWKAEEFPEKQFNDRRQIGVIAQEVERQFPEVVDTNKDGFKSVNYPALVSPLIEAVKALYRDLFGVKAVQHAQTRQIASKADKEEIKKLKEENAEIKLRLEKLEKMLKSK